MTTAKQGQEIDLERKSASFLRIYQPELLDAQVFGIPTAKAMFVLATDASVLSISGIFYQEQEWNGRSIQSTIAYGNKNFSETELKYGLPNAELFAVMVIGEKYRAYQGSGPYA